MRNTLRSSNHNPPYKSIERASTKSRSALVEMGAGDAVVVSSRLWASLVGARSRFSIRAKNLAHEAALFSASDPNRMLTTKETAAWLRKSSSYVYRHADELGARNVGGRGRGADLLFPLGELEAWLAQHRQSRNQHRESRP